MKENVLNAGPHGSQQILLQKFGYVEIVAVRYRGRRRF